MKVRAKALSKFGKNSISKGVPMAMLEDVLVPVYLFHRYQVEAATKSDRRTILFLCHKGDGQMITQSVSKENQLKALYAVVDCMDPKALALPQSIIDLIPPSPANYDYNSYSIEKLALLLILWQQLNPLLISLSFLFNTKRLTD
jgi:hypothetical protein